MKYNYTWNHLLLLAKLCGRTDDEESVTASWIQITEEHNRQTFPFTLWPLTYRTCEVTTSPAMCSPIHIQTCDSSVKMYKCNEIMIICIQDNFQDNSRDRSCCQPCIADIDSDEDSDESSDDTSDDNHVNHHSLSRHQPLIPCNASHRYHHIKTKVNNMFYDTQENIECVLCIGHGAAAAVASCLASEMSLTFEEEKEFLGLDTKRICVDFVGFSDTVVASNAYWDKHASYIDKYLSVVFEDHAVTKIRADEILVANPRSIRVMIETLPTTSLSKTFSTRSMSVVFGKLKNKDKRHKRDKTVNSKRSISDYISAINKKINLPINP